MKQMQKENNDLEVNGENKNILKVFYYAFIISLLYWVVIFAVLGNNSFFKAFRYMGF